MNQKFPVDATKQRVIKVFERLGFRVLPNAEHVSMVRDNADGTRTPLTMPSHRRIKGATLRMICRQTGIARDKFMAAYLAS